MQQPTEIVTLADALDELKRRGFTAQFTVVSGRLRATGIAKTFAADRVVVREQYRFEGISDPDDMAILYGIETNSRIRGTLADAFGVYADPAVGAFMAGVAARRGGS